MKTLAGLPRQDRHASSRASSRASCRPESRLDAPSTARGAAGAWLAAIALLAFSSGCGDEMGGVFGDTPTPPPPPDTLPFIEDFESGVLADCWSVSATGGGRRSSRRRTSRTAGHTIS